MKRSANRHSRHAGRVQQQLLMALRGQWQDAPLLFTDRDDDAAEVASLLRDFEFARDEAVDADRYN